MSEPIILLIRRHRGGWQCFEALFALLYVPATQDDRTSSDSIEDAARFRVPTASSSRLSPPSQFP
jgi:hypothetical protein